MAYWGEAMCYKRPLWQTEDLAAAQAVLAKLNASGLALASGVGVPPAYPPTTKRSLRWNCPLKGQTLLFDDYLGISVII